MTEADKKIEMLEQMLKKLTAMYYEAQELDNNSAVAISAAEDTVRNAIKYLKEGK